MRAIITLNALDLRRVVGRALLAETHMAAPDRMQLAEAFGKLCERLRRRLQPLFGSTAVSALFARAVHLATGDFPWLATAVPRSLERCSAADLSGRGDLTAATVEEGLAAVLAHNVGLLSTFIGEVLRPASRAAGVGSCFDRGLRHQR